MPELTLSASADMNIGNAGITAVFGYLVVFTGLLILMLVLYVMGAVFRAKAKQKKEADAVKAQQAAAQETITPNQPLAPGSAGHIKRYQVPDKEAAMVMAVVAYKLQKPLNELRFLSIKEVNSDEV